MLHVHEYLFHLHVNDCGRIKFRSLAPDNSSFSLWEDSDRISLYSGVTSGKMAPKCGIVVKNLTSSIIRLQRDPLQYFFLLKMSLLFYEEWYIDGACTPYSPQNPSYSESCGQPCWGHFFLKLASDGPKSEIRCTLPKKWPEVLKYYLQKLHCAFLVVAIWSGMGEAHFNLMAPTDLREPLCPFSKMSLLALSLFAPLLLLWGESNSLDLEW